MKEIRHEQESLGRIQYWMIGFNHAQQLEQGVQFHELDACGRINPRFGEFLERFFHHALRAAVPITIGIAKNHIIPPHKTEIHTPGIDTDAPDSLDPGIGGPGQALLEFMEQAKQIPLIMIQIQNLILDEIQLTAVHGTD